MSVVRISRGFFKPDEYDKIAKHLEEAQQTLVPGFFSLTGACIIGQALIINQTQWST
jgi:hypothetical protein